MTYYDPKNKRIEETQYNTQIEGKVAIIKDRSVSIQMMSDGECFLNVPISRVPKVCLVVGTMVKIFLTTKYGHVGIVKAKDHEPDHPGPSMA